MLRFLIILSISLNGCSLLKKYPQDNFLEEIAEQIVKQETGLDLDFSPATPEKS